MSKFQNTIFSLMFTFILLPISTYAQASNQVGEEELAKQLEIAKKLKSYNNPNSVMTSFARTEFYLTNKWIIKNAGRLSMEQIKALRDVSGFSAVTSVPAHSETYKDVFYDSYRDGLMLGADITERPLTDIKEIADKFDTPQTTYKILSEFIYQRLVSNKPLSKEEADEVRIYFDSKFLGIEIFDKTKLYTYKMTDGTTVFLNYEKLGMYETLGGGEGRPNVRTISSFDLNEDVSKLRDLISAASDDKALSASVTTQEGVQALTTNMPIALTKTGASPDNSEAIDLLKK